MLRLQGWKALAGNTAWQATEAALQPKLCQAQYCCLMPRFQSVVPVIQKTMQALADMTAAVARTGARANEGNLLLARATSHVQQARPVPACLHSTHDWQRRRCSPSCLCRAPAVSGG